MRQRQNTHYIMKGSVNVCEGQLAQVECYCPPGGRARSALAVLKSVSLVCCHVVQNTD